MSLKMELRQNESLFDSENFGFHYAIPNYLNVIVLIIGLIGMYNSIEIGHAVYAILFADLVSALVHTMIHLIGFNLLNSKRYFPFHNLFNGSCLLTHCVCWCTTMILRYFYVAHEEWIYNKFPDMKQHRLIGLGLTAAFTILMYVPMIGTALILGKIIFPVSSWF